MRFTVMSFVCLLSLSSCLPENSNSPTIQYRDDLANLKLPQTAFDYTPEYPAYFTDDQHPLHLWVADFDNTPANNPVTDAGATLGRVLFYDTRLSANDTVACASCHQQAKGFSDDAIRSEGFQGGLTRRHSMGLANARFYPNGRFFWDERAATLEEQVLQPIQDSVEMGMDLTTLLGLLAATDEYPQLFQEAFGSSDITEEKMARALAQFVRSMVSFQSKFDQGIDNKWDNLTDAEYAGLRRFLSMCGGCHQGVLQSGRFAANNGLDDVSTALDLGLAEVTGLVTDEGKFKVPSLRNVAVTAPYMHDGRFQTLEQVVAHYMTGVADHDNLDPRLQTNGSPSRFPLSEKQQMELVAFLQTLTDEALLSDEKFSNPFLDE